MISDELAKELTDALRATFPHVRITQGTEARAIGWGILAIAAERMQERQCITHIQRAETIADTIAEYTERVQMALDELLQSFLDRRYKEHQGHVRVTFERDGDLHPYEAVIEYIPPPANGRTMNPERCWGHGDTPSRALQNAIEDFEE